MNTIYVYLYTYVYARAHTHVHGRTCSLINTNIYMLMVIHMPTHNKKNYKF